MPNLALLPSLSTRIIELDAFIDGYPEVEHGLASTLGGAPLESGARITDHVIAHEPTLRLFGHVSNFPGAGGSAPADTWAQIRRLHRAAEPLTVITPLERFDEMVISRLRAPQRGRGLDFTIDLEGILRVGLDARAPVGTRVGPAVEGRRPEVRLGRVATTAFP